MSNLTGAPPLAQGGRGVLSLEIWSFKAERFQCGARGACAPANIAAPDELLWTIEKEKVRSGRHRDALRGRTA
jgi:hypothetical protein